MELLRLTLDGFRGLYTEIDFSHNTVITAGNGKGKTTIMNAILWLLCGVDDSDRSNYNLFDNRLPQNDPYNPLSASVTAEFDSMIISRSASQMWGKDKNNGGYLRKGDEYKYLINDMEVSATRFKEVIETELMPISKLKFILNVHRWELLDEKGLRDQIKDLAPTDLKPTDERYDPVMWAINESGVTGAKKHFAKRIKEYQAEAEKLNIEILAMGKRMPILTDIDGRREQLAEAQKELDELNARSEPTIPIDILQKQQEEAKNIFQLKSDIQTAKVQYNYDNQIALREAETALREAQKAKCDIESEKDFLKSLNHRLEVLDADYGQKRSEYERLQTRMFTGMCPTCGQPLVGNDRAQKLQEFKEQKQREEVEIITEGKRIDAERTKLRSEIEAKTARIAELKESMKTINKTELIYEQTKHRCEIPFEDTDEYKQLAAQLFEMEANRTPTPETVVSDPDKAIKGMLMVTIQRLNSEIALGERDNKERERLEKEIQRLVVKRESALGRVTDNDQSLDLVKAYEKEWMQMLENEINSNFTICEVQMNDVSKTGEIVDCCKIRMSNVKDTLNTASRLMVGMDIAEAFQRKYGVDLPLIVDNAESIERERIKTNHQLILMYMVDGQDLKIN